MQRDLLTREQIKELVKTSDLPGWLAIGWSWLVIAGCFVAVREWPVVFPLAVVLLGGRQLALAVMMHEAAHRTLFETRWLNERVADWLCARPVWSDVARYRAHHLGHHAHTGTEKDPDLVLAPETPMSRASLVRKIARDLSGLAGLRRTVGLAAIDADLLVYDVAGGAKRAPWRGLVHHVGSFVMHAWPTIVWNVALAWLVGPVAYLAWALAWLTTYSLFLRVRSLAEHACMERTDDIARNTRTTTANLIARMTVAPLHVNYHLEHHLLPTVPWYRLPAMQRLIAGRVPAPTPGYAAVLTSVSRSASR